MKRATEQWNTLGHLERFTLALSIGSSEWRPGRTFEEVLTDADQGMYAQKGDKTLQEHSTNDQWN
jgi:hypothetical protein